LKEKVLKEYVFSNKKLKFIGFALSFFPILVFKYFLNTLFVICLPGSYPNLSGKKIDYLFFSHFTKSNPKNGSDRIFGKLLDSKKSVKRIMYFNHSKFYQFFLLKDKKPEHTLTKNLPIRDSIISINRIYTNAIYLYFHILSKFKSTNGIEISTLFEQISRRTISNYFIKKQVEKIFLNNNVKNVVITYEGHAYEYIISSCINRLGGIKLFLYQHSPFSKGQFSMTSKKLINGNILLFSSKTVKKYFIENQLVKENSAILVGSNKYQKREKFARRKKFQQVLLAPEGINSTFSDYLGLSRILKSRMQINVVLRIHPDMNLSIKNYLKLKLFLFLGLVSLSNNSLKEDLKLSKFCIYTASSVGVEAIDNYCTPIFFGTKLDYKYVNPLYIFSNLNYIDKDVKNFDFSEFKEINWSKTENYYSKLKSNLLGK
jgi:hypothetical protein